MPCGASESLWVSHIRIWEPTYEKVDSQIFDISAKILQEKTNTKTWKKSSKNQQIDIAVLGGSLFLKSVKIYEKLRKYVENDIFRNPPIQRPIHNIQNV